MAGGTANVNDFLLGQDNGEGQGRPSFEMLPLDVTSDESVEAVVREVMRLDGRIDLLVNNAGFSIAPAGAEESSSSRRGRSSIRTSSGPSG